MMLAGFYYCTVHTDEDDDALMHSMVLHMMQIDDKSKCVCVCVCVCVCEMNA
jgi:hypothetical protein